MIDFLRTLNRHNTWFNLFMPYVSMVFMHNTLVCRVHEYIENLGKLLMSFILSIFLELVFTHLEVKSLV